MKQLIYLHAAAMKRMLQAFQPSGSARSETSIRIDFGMDHPEQAFRDSRELLQERGAITFAPEGKGWPFYRKGPNFDAVLAELSPT